ncbi:MAG TPA: lipase maturation factor family protein [Terriglobales bacterium]|nr:lipase maturation factor family protein [Terriglobales bacterium]
MRWNIGIEPARCPARLAATLPESRRVAALLTRWLGFVFFWALLAWWRQAAGLIGPAGIAPAADYLAAVQAQFGFWHRLWFAPTLLWLASGTLALRLVCGAGLAASVLVMLRRQPRLGLALCLLAFLSLIAPAQAFASYQSDGMLVSAGFIALFLDDRAPSWWSLFALRWLWFSIYFGSGIAKLLSGDPQWRHLTALDHYYENLPLPNWLGWYAQQHLPHAAEAAIALSILGLELGLAWLCFAPRRLRLLCFWIATPFQIAIILTANYGFLNYLVLGLGFALLDDRHLDWLLGRFRRPPLPPSPARAGWATAAASLLLAAWFLLTAANLAQRLWPAFPAPTALSDALQPFRVADPFGLFAVMTTARYEIEFQGSADGTHWLPYPFRYQPQDPRRAPDGDWFFLAPYQPRFDWNLWFASLGSYRDNDWVEATELRLLQNDPSVLGLFAGNPFAAAPPRAVRAVLWQYWFATPAQHRQQGIWWTRRQLGLYAPELAMTPQGPAAVPIP